MSIFFFIVPNHCVGVGCRCFVFVPLMYTLFPTIDKVTATFLGGVNCCFLLSFIVVVFIKIVIMIMIMILIISISIAFFNLVMLLSPKKYYLSWPYFYFICLMLNLYFIIYSVFTFIQQFFW